MSLRRLAFVTTLLAGAVLAGSAYADDAIPTDRAAQALFDSARAHLESGDVETACTELSKSYKLEAAGGTLLNLAFCHERLGMLATAQAEYEDSVKRAQKDGRADREKTATDRLQAIAARVPKIVIVAPPGKYEDLALEIDGARDPQNSFGVAIPVDPGTHDVRVSARGKISTSVGVTAHEGTNDPVTMPTLADDPRATPTPMPTQPTYAKPPEEPETTRVYRPIHYVLFIGAGVGVVSGLVFGGLALSANSTASNGCTASREFCKDQSSLDAVSNAKTFAWASTIAISAGVLSAIVALEWPKKTIPVTAAIGPGSLIFQGYF